MNPQENQSPTPPTSGPSSFVPGSQFVNYAHATPPQTPPPVQAEAPISPRPPVTYKPKRSHHVGLVTFVIIILVLILGIGAAYAFVLAPDHALPRAASVLAGRYKFNSNLVVSVTSDDPTVSGSLTVSGNTDGTTKPIRVQSFIDLESPQFPVSAEVRFVDNVLYGQVTQVPEIASQYAAPYMNKWYSVSLDTFKAFAEKYHATSTLGVGGPTIEESYAKGISEGILTDRRFLGVGYVDGKLVRRYSLTINKDALIDQAVSSSVAKDNPQFSSAIADAKQAYASITIEPVTVTVDLISGALVSFDDTIDVAPGQAVLIQKAAKVSIHFSYADISPAADLSAPIGATSLDSYLTGAMSSLDDAQNRGKSSRVQADLYQERTAIETDYSAANGYVNACNAKDMDILTNDIRSQGSVPLCRNNRQAYVITASVVDTSTTAPSFYCMDSTGKSTTLSQLPTGYSCE